MSIIINDLIFYNDKQIRHKFNLSLLQYSQCFDCKRVGSFFCTNLTICVCVCLASAQCLIDTCQTSNQFLVAVDKKSRLEHIEPIFSEYFHHINVYFEEK